MDALLRASSVAELSFVFLSRPVFFFFGSRMWRPVGRGDPCGPWGRLNFIMTLLFYGFGLVMSALLILVSRSRTGCERASRSRGVRREGIANRCSGAGRREASGLGSL